LQERQLALVEGEQAHDHVGGGGVVRVAVRDDAQAHRGLARGDRRCPWWTERDAQGLLRAGEQRDERWIDNGPSLTRTDDGDAERLGDGTEVAQPCLDDFFGAGGHDHLACGDLHFGWHGAQS
jgi:hypothetical protein